MKVRLANLNEIVNIKKFIDNNWKKNHILAKHSKLLIWQHRNVDKKKLSIAVLENNEKKIVGILGFISINNYINVNGKKKDYIWLGIWCLDKSINKINGLKLIYYFLNNRRYKYIGGIGLTKNIIQLYKKLNFKVGEMKHFYILNNKIKKTVLSKKLLKNKFINEKDFIINESKKIHKSIFNQKVTSFKNYRYFKYRYEKHPIYKYRFLNIKKNNKNILLIIIRKIKIKNHSIIRIIDTFGDWSSVNNIGSLLHKFILKEKSEYIDFLYNGYNEKYIILNGFKIKKNKKIIPNHFEPFEGVKNQPLYYCYKSQIDFDLHKGDADSDRPNLIYS